MKHNTINHKWVYLEHFFEDSFCDGQIERELRLSPEELSYLKTKYPQASFQSLSEDEGSASGKAWYLVCLSALGDIEPLH
mgnify:CR=1 FL=1